MKTRITFSPLRSLVTTAIFGALALSFAPLSSASDNISAPGVAVQYSNLNVSTSGGATALYGRIRAAAEALCSPLSHGDLSSKMHRDACVSQSIAAAVSKVNQGALFAVYNAKNARPLPMIVATEQAR